MSIPLRVLVVDDDPDLAETIEEILTGRGHSVTLARDGETAVDLFRRQPFDLCFMDVALPGSDGVECFLQIRQLWPRARVVMMTGYSVQDLLARALSAGAMAVLHKPLDVGRILAMLESVAGQRSVVLVVEDDPDFAELLRDALSAAGYSPLLARDGELALERIKADAVDLMILDLRLPGVSGLDLYQELKRAGRSVPTIVVTGYAAEEGATIEALKRESVKTVLEKPIDIGELTHIVDDVCAQATSRP